MFCRHCFFVDNLHNARELLYLFPIVLFLPNTCNIIIVRILTIIMLHVLFYRVHDF